MVVIMTTVTTLLYNLVVKQTKNYFSLNLSSKSVYFVINFHTFSQPTREIPIPAIELLSKRLYKIFTFKLLYL